MAKTSRRTWQKREQAAAEFFGAKRQPGSGSGGRDDVTCSDSTHPCLYIESKFRASHSVRTLHDDVKVKAAKEGKAPVLCLMDKGRRGFLIVVHSDDFGEVIGDWFERVEQFLRETTE